MTSFAELVSDLPSTLTKPGTRAEALSRVKAWWQAERVAIFDRFHAGKLQGVEAGLALSDLTDRLICGLHGLACKAHDAKGNRDLALVAVGGYGRSLMAPFSDIDLLVIGPTTLDENQQKAIDFLLYFIWDLKLKLGHAIRSPSQCVTACREDSTIRTALSDARLICGSQALFSEFGTRFKQLRDKDSQNFIAEKLKERALRHDRAGQVRYALEPDIKEGRGGLRDLHSLLWIAKDAYKIQSLKGLEEKQVLSPRQRAALERAEAFFWDVRFHLHLSTNRAEEKLTFDQQLILAERQGIADKPKAGGRAVERFMRLYFQHAKAVGTLTDFVLGTLDARRRKQTLWQRLNPFAERPRCGQLEGFLLGADQLAVPDADWFRRHPKDLIRIYKVAQEQGLEIQPLTQRYLAQRVWLIDDQIRRDPEVNGWFVAIVTFAKQSPRAVLSAMNDSGVLGAFVPDFESIVGMMQFDRYHHYTVDEHSLFAVENLHKIETKVTGDSTALASELLAQLGVQSRRELYVAMFLHDVAKGRGGDHAILGAAVAEQLCPRFGLGKAETDTVAFLVRQHLSLSDASQKRDLEDPQTISDLADLIQSPERLKQLFILTVADIMAVGPDRYTSWKASLMRQAYYATAEHLSGGLIAQQQEARTKARLQSLKALSQISQASLDAFIGFGHPAYWLNYSPERLSQHAAWLDGKDEELILFDWYWDEARQLQAIVIRTPDYAGRVSQFAGVFALEDLSVEEARVHTLLNGMALDTFWLRADADQGALGDTVKASVEDRIHETLSQTLDIEEQIQARAPQIKDRHQRTFIVPPQVVFNNAASEKHTVIEVSGSVNKAVLFRITHQIKRENLSIQTAKITTYGHRFVDVFYVVTGMGDKLTSPARQERLATRICAALAP